MKKNVLFLLLICFFGLSCQNRVQDDEQSPYLDRPAGDSLLRDTASDDSATWEHPSQAGEGNRSKTTDSLQSPSFN